VGQPGVQPLGDTVDKQVGHRKLAQVPARERFVLLPQALSDLADGGAGQEPVAGGVAKRCLDVSGTQATREYLDGQALQLGRPPGQPGAYPRDERLRAIRHLRHAVLDSPFRGPQPAAAVAVAVAGAGRGPVFVVLPPDRPGDFGLQRFLHDLAHGQLQQLGPRVAVHHSLAQ
jgi:hypothetical protein